MVSSYSVVGGWAVFLSFVIDDAVLWLRWGDSHAVVRKVRQELDTLHDESLEP